MTFISRIFAATAIPLVLGGSTAATNVGQKTEDRIGRDPQVILINQSPSDDFVSGVKFRGNGTVDDSNIVSASSIIGNSNFVSRSSNVQGMEIEVEHGVTTLVPHGGSDDSDVSNLSTLDSSSAASNSGLEVEVEHGVTTLVQHGGNNDSSDDDTQGMEVEVEHGVTTLVPHGGDSSSVVSNSSATDTSNVNSNSGLEVEVEHGVTTLVPHGGNNGSGKSGSGGSGGGRGKN